MKRFIMLLALILALALPGFALAAGTMTLASDPVMDRANAGITVSLTWTGTPSFTTNQITDAAGRTISSYLSGYFFYAAAFMPSSGTAPQNGYTVTITDALGMVVGSFTSLSSTTVSEPSAANMLGYFPFALAPFLPYTIAVTNNNVSSGGGTITLSFVTAH